MSTRAQPSIRMIPTFARKPSASMKSMTHGFFHIRRSAPKTAARFVTHLAVGRRSRPAFEIASTRDHELDEAPLVAALHELLNPLRGGAQRGQRRVAVVVQCLNLEIQMWIVGRDEARD